MILKIKNLKLIFVLSLFIASCSSNDDGPSGSIDPNPLQGNKNAYTLTIDGKKTYSKTYEEESEDGALVTVFTKSPGETEAISLMISDDVNDLQLIAALPLNPATNQPFLLGNLSKVDLEGNEQSTIVITIGNKNYISYSGTAKLSNLKISMLGAYTGFPAYDMIIDGKFDDVDTEAVEQIHITGAVKAISYF